MTARILVVEDEAGLRMAIVDRLAAEGYAAHAAADGEEGLARASGEAFDLVILDVMLPRRNGLDVCRDLRQRGIDTPILMLTARGETTDKVVGLKLGADDYVVKPFEMAELLARVEAMLRRRAPRAPADAQTYAFGDVHVDFRRAVVTRAGAPVDLSALELRILRYFIAHRDEAISRDRLLDEVWGYDATPNTRTVDVHIAWLRQKLEPAAGHPRYILTVHGIGYRFVG